MAYNDPTQDIFDRYATKWIDQVEGLKERILSNLVMVSQIPAQTFQEADRGAYVLERFIECGVEGSIMDKLGNVSGIIRGRNSTRSILISAHMDTLFDSSYDHNVSIDTNRAEGTGIADNALGVSFLISLPEILEMCKISFDCDIQLLATVSSKEKGDFSGIRFFLDNALRQPSYHLNIEGITLGQVDHSSLSRVRADISASFHLEQASSWRTLTQVSAIMMLSDIMDCLFSIPLPGKPKTVLNVGRIEGGNSYSRICSNASLQLEVRSESDEITENLMDQIKDSCHEIAAKYGVEFNVNFFSRNNVAGLKYSHPLVKAANSIVKNFNIKTKMGPSNSEIAVSLSKNIPSVTLGLTTGAEDKDIKSYVNLETIPKGIVQIMLLIESIDKGYCDDEHK